MRVAAWESVLQRFLWNVSGMLSSVSGYRGQTDDVEMTKPTAVPERALGLNSTSAWPDSVKRLGPIGVETILGLLEAWLWCNLELILVKLWLYEGDQTHLDIGVSIGLFPLIFGDSEGTAVE